jgi:hypothetical protein
VRLAHAKINSGNMRTLVSLGKSCLHPIEVARTTNP